MEWIYKGLAVSKGSASGAGVAAPVHRVDGPSFSAPIKRGKREARPFLDGPNLAAEKQRALRVWGYGKWGAGHRGMGPGKRRDAIVLALVCEIS